MDDRTRYNARQKHKAKMRRIANIGMCVCVVGVLACGAFLYFENVDYSKGDEAYQQLRLDVQKPETAQTASTRDEMPVVLPVPASTSEAAQSPSEARQTASPQTTSAPNTSAQNTATDAPATATQAPVQPTATPYASPIQFSALQEINPDVKAWLTSEGTIIDYPVAQGADNTYYLSHLYTRERNKVGCLFMDYRNAGDFSDKNTVIYGHNLQSGRMFASLMDYKDQDYYELFPSMVVYTPTGKATIELVAGFVVSGNREFVRFEFENDDDFLRYVREQQNKSTFSSHVEVRPEDQLVTLCTCSYEYDNARYALIGRLVWQQ